MKIGIQTWGSHGDIRPFIALANGLQAAGHDVTLVVTCVDSERYNAIATYSGVKLRIIATPVVTEPILLEKIGNTLVKERNAIKQTQIAIQQLLLPAETEMFQASERLCLENELVIGHYFLYPLAVAAERHSRPYVSVALAHGAVPSAFQPPSGVPNLGTLGNRLAWKLARAVLNRTLKRYPDQLRGKNGMKAARDMIDTVWASKDLTLVAISPIICERKPDWPSHYQVCGALDTQESIAEGKVSEDLLAFLSAGTAPVYMTFGSMISGNDEKQAIALCMSAAEAAGVRAVIQAPHWHELGCQSNSQICYVSSTPHSAVFPKCSLVVHHGGAGTSHSALRAGKASVIVAHTAEQELWGRELQRLEVAGTPIVRERATARKIAAAINVVVSSDHMPENARSLGSRLVKERGVDTAVGLINARFAA